MLKGRHEAKKLASKLEERHVQTRNLSHRPTNKADPSLTQAGSMLQTKQHMDSELLVKENSMFTKSTMLQAVELETQDMRFFGLNSDPTSRKNAPQSSMAILGQQHRGR